MDLNPKTIFLPSVGCDLVINSSSVYHKILPTIIYETNFHKNTITIAQPSIPFNENTEFNQLHLTTILSTDKRKLRVGLACKPIAFFSNYRLAEGKKVKAILLAFKLPIIETNIRSAFRLVLDTRHTIRAKLVYQKNPFFSPEHFRIRDISVTGAGLLIPKKIYHGINPLTQLEQNSPLAMGMKLVDTVEHLFKGPLALAGRVQRIVHEYSQTHSLVAIKFIAMEPHHEVILSEYIHIAQIQHLNRFLPN